MTNYAGYPTVGDPTELLYDLLLGLFRTEGELERFLARENHPGAYALGPATKGSRASSIREIAAALVRSGQADDALFAALERRQPDRADDIRAVARALGAFSTSPGDDPAIPPSPPGGTSPGDDPVVPPSPPASPSPGDVPVVPPSPSPSTSRGGPEPISGPYADFAASLRASLDSMPPEDTSALGLEPGRWPWTAAASVLGSFDPLRLRPYGALSVAAGATSALADLVRRMHDGSWTLTDPVRTAALARLATNETGDPRAGLRAAIEANRDLPDRRRDVLAELLDGHRPNLAWLDRAALLDLAAVLGWVEPLLGDLPVVPAQVHAAADRRLLIDPLRTLVGTRIEGRQDELRLLRDLVSGVGDVDLIHLRGIGGAGKSTLIGRVLLDLEEKIGIDPVPFVYIDFDKAAHDARDVNGLVGQIARQLRLLYTVAADLAEAFAAVESVSAGDIDAAYAAAQLDLDATTGSSEPGTGDLVAVLGDRLRLVQEGTGRPDAPALVVVLDTCEEIARRGPGAINAVTGLLRDLRRELPSLRVVVSGRTTFPVYSPQAVMLPLELGELDRMAALAVLEQRGVADPAIREAVIDRFGANPLTLRLAAEALARAPAPGEILNGVPDLTAAVGGNRAIVEIAAEQVQGMLYSRILGHIADTDIAIIAHPGLAVRRVTPEVIERVLAGPCKLDPRKSAEIFGRLLAELSLFELDESDGSLRHRQDVRQIMLRSINSDRDRAVVVTQIHELAVGYYAAGTGPVAAAEELYHRLARDEEPRSLDPLWDPDLEESLAPALGEPLTPRARNWLERRILGGDLATDRAAWAQADWEAEAESRARSWLASGRPDQALAVLAERVERLPGIGLAAVQASALLDSGRPREAGDVLRAALATPPDGTLLDERRRLELTELALATAAALDDGDGVREAALACSARVGIAGDGIRAVLALGRGVAHLVRLDRPVGDVGTELVRRFAALTREQLLADPQAVRQVLADAAAACPDLIALAAATVGDLPADAGGPFADDRLVLTRILVAAGPEAQAAVGAAQRRGRPSHEPDAPGTLAGVAVRSGQVGQAVLLALTHTPNVEEVRRMIVKDLLLPPQAGAGRPT